MEALAIKISPNFKDNGAQSGSAPSDCSPFRVGDLSRFDDTEQDVCG